MDGTGGFFMGTQFVLYRTISSLGGFVPVPVLGIWVKRWVYLPKRRFQPSFIAA